MWAMLASDIVKYERGQSIHWPSRRDCSVWIAAKRRTRSRHARAKASSPIASMARLSARPSARSTSTSTHRPWQSNPFW